MVLWEAINMFSFGKLKHKSTGTKPVWYLWGGGSEAIEFLNDTLVSKWYDDMG
jgi:hypothetical protein